MFILLKNKFLFYCNFYILINIFIFLKSNKIFFFKHVFLFFMRLNLFKKIKIKNNSILLKFSYIIYFFIFKFYYY